MPSQSRLVQKIFFSIKIFFEFFFKLSQHYFMFLYKKSYRILGIFVEICPKYPENNILGYLGQKGYPSFFRTSSWARYMLKMTVRMDLTILENVFLN